MADMINPYIAGAPVTEKRMFYGREDVFHWIESSLTGQYADHILVIHGQRRVGKTSVLKQLGNRLPKRYIPVFFDLQGRTHTTLDRFLWWLAREIVRVLKQERGIESPLPEKEAFTADLEYFEHRFLLDLKPALGDSTLLLTFDEFDNLEESEVKEELAGPLVDYLRRLMGQAGLNFIFSIGSSGRKLENMQASYTEFFKTALYKKISFLSEEQTRDLVVKPVAGLLEYERAAVDHIFQIASGHPYFTQLTCHELFSRCQRTEARKIQKADVDSILDDVVERGTVNLKFTWDEASDIEKWSLAALATLEGKTDNRALTTFLQSQRVRFSESDLTSGLLHLREKDVLTPENRFVIYLLKIWLQKNRPLEQVREELTEVNPIANRYIEIGLEFKDSGVYEKAIESFLEALAIAKDNIQAQVNIALTYMDQKAYDKAVVEFEKALAIDDEDVSARAGLCEAHLALGNLALTRGRAKEAVLSYQRVLAINAEHTEARQRMAEITRQRAEKALVDGKDEEALSAFSEALKFTPEDQSLLTRVETVQAEKKAKVLATFLARADREASAKNWEKSLATLKEALELAPQEKSILDKINLVQTSQVKERLDAILAKADQAEKSGRWEAAISALGEYLTVQPHASAIQERLNHLIAAKRSAWINAIFSRVDSAMASERWEVATAALNEALLLEPGNADFTARLTQVNAAQKAATLKAILRRADEAASASRWDEAIEALNAGLASNPNHETLHAKLAEVRKAKREARLKAALRLADTAAQAGKWEAAVEALNEVLALEPENAEFEKKLVEIRAQEHASKLNTARTQVQSLARAERFDESLKAWEAYLALGPDDREAAQVEIERIKQAQYLANNYAEACKSYANKNYDKAIGMLKSIVVEDADYKDATRLLADAIELRRTERKWWQNRWLWGGIGLSAVLASAWFVIRFGLPLLAAEPARTAAATGVSAPHVETLASATALPLPTITSTPLPLEWTRLNSGQFLPRDQVTAIVVDPTDAGVMYVGTDNAGIFKSIDGGLSWQPSHAGLGRAWVYSLAIDPKNPQTLYAGTLLGGVYKTTDSGANWSFITSNLATGSEWIGILKVDPINSQHLYYTQADDLYESQDAGNTWTLIHNQESCPDRIAGLVIHSKDTSILYASDEKHPHNVCNPGIYASSDRGQTWSYISAALTTPFYGEVSGRWDLELAFDESEREILFANHPEAGLYLTSDSGTTWESLPAQKCDAFAPDPQNGSNAYCTYLDRIYQTQNGGNTWVATDRLDAKQPIQTIAVSPHSSDTVLIGGSGLWLSTDTGKSFSVRNSGLAATRFEIAIDSSDPSALWIQVGNTCDFYRSSDGARTWELISDYSCYLGISSEPPTMPTEIDAWSLFAHPAVLDRLYAVLNRGNPPYLYISDDGGKSWHATTGMESIGDGKLFFNYNQGGRMYAIGDAEAFRSDDDGETWQMCAGTGSWSARATSRMVVDPRDADHLILSTRGDGVLISEDGCLSWHQSGAGLASLFVNTITFDPNHPDTLYAGTDGGAYISYDSGETWGQVNDGLLGATVVYSIAVDKESNIYAATPYGIFKLENK